MQMYIMKPNAQFLFISSLNKIYKPLIYSVLKTMNLVRKRKRAIQQKMWTAASGNNNKVNRLKINKFHKGQMQVQIRTEKSGHRHLFLIPLVSFQTVVQDRFLSSRLAGLIRPY